jgi:GT2 family glycosyltransferase
VNNTLPSITIVVPVYGDVESLLACIASLKENIDFDRDQVLLVNDCGPDADAIERAVIASLDGHRGFRYERNAENLGFVGNCNRAVFELDTSDNDILLLNSDTVTTPGFLDEMREVLYAAEDHGVVCARSNNATIASIPFRLTHGSAPRTEARTVAVFDALSDYLPRWYVSPVSMGFCFLTRRSLIREHGLFDNVFAPGYGEENDYCLRINAHGYKSLISNRALVLHAGSKSFVGARRNKLRSAHQAILETRYPFYGQATGGFLRYWVHPADRFADLLVDAPSPLRVAVDLRGCSDAELLRILPALAPPHDHIALEVVTDPAAASQVTNALPGATVRSEVVDDDIVAIGVYVAGKLDGDRFASFGRRYAFWARLDIDEDVLRWADAGPNSARLFLDAVAARVGDERVEVGTETGGVLPTVLNSWSTWNARPLREKVESLVARAETAALVDAAARRDTAGDEEQLRRVRDELAAVTSGRAYRAAEAGVKLGKRVLRRR